MPVTLPTTLPATLPVTLPATLPVKVPTTLPVTLPVTGPVNLPFKLPVIEILPLPENLPENAFTEYIFDPDIIDGEVVPIGELLIVTFPSTPEFIITLSISAFTTYKLLFTSTLLNELLPVPIVTLPNKRPFKLPVIQILAVICSSLNVVF